MTIFWSLFHVKKPPFFHFNKKYRTSVFGGVGEPPLKFDQVTDSLIDNYWQNTPQIVPRNYGVMAAVSNGGAAYRAKGIHILSELIKFPNGTLALDVFGRSHGKLSPHSSENYIRLQKEEMKAGYYNLPKVIQHYKFYLSFENSRCRHYSLWF